LSEAFEGGIVARPQGLQLILEVEATESLMDAKDARADDDGAVRVGRELPAQGDRRRVNDAIVLEAIEAGAVVLAGDEEELANLNRSGDVEVAAAGRDDFPEALAGGDVPAAEGVEVIADDLPFAAEGADDEVAVGSGLAGRLPEDLA
jgi:hypothetical protein